MNSPLGKINKNNGKSFRPGQMPTKQSKYVSKTKLKLVERLKEIYASKTTDKLK